jgi:lipopolysaccharide biosynthesis glycosyltransferase
LGDQDAVNLYYDGRIKYASEYIINLDERCFARLLRKIDLTSALKSVEQNTIIVHFNGDNKPWNEGYKGYLNVFYHADKEDVKWKKSVSI